MTTVQSSESETVENLLEFHRKEYQPLLCRGSSQSKTIAKQRQTSSTMRTLRANVLVYLPAIKLLKEYETGLRQQRGIKRMHRDIKELL